MMMKRTFIALALASSVAMSAQATNRVGVTIYKFDDNFMALFRKNLQADAKQDSNLELLMNDSQNNQSMQNDQVDVMLAKGVKALAINLVDPAAGATVLNKARSQGVPVVFFNKDPGAKAIASYDKAYYVGADPKQSGIIQAELIAKAWKANPDWDKNHDGVIQFALLKGEPGHPDAEARTKWVIDTLNDQEKLKTQQLFLDSAMWDTAKAKDITQAWLSGPQAKNIEVIISNNDAMAMGAYQATKAANVKLPIFGVDALPEALQMIKKGELAGTVLNDAKGQAAGVYTLVDNLAAGRAPTEGSNYQLDNRYLRIPYVGIDSSNLSDYLK